MGPLLDTPGPAPRCPLPAPHPAPGPTPVPPRPAPCPCAPAPRAHPAPTSHVHAPVPQARAPMSLPGCERLCSRRHAPGGAGPAHFLLAALSPRRRSATLAGWPEEPPPQQSGNTGPGFDVRPAPLSRPLCSPRRDQHSGALELAEGRPRPRRWPASTLSLSPPAAEAPGLPPLLRPPPAFLQGIIHFLSWKNIPTSFPFPFSSEFTQGHLQSPRFLCEEGPGGHEDRL